MAIVTNPLLDLTCMFSIEKSPNYETRLVVERATKNEHHSHQVGDSLFYHQVLHTCLSEYCFYVKTNLDNYNELINIKEHIQNIGNILQLVIQNNDVMCKILPTTFHDLFECRTISFSLGPVCFQENNLLETIFPTFQYLVTLRKIGQGKNIF